MKNRMENASEILQTWKILPVFRLVLYFLFLKFRKC